MEELKQALYTSYIDHTTNSKPELQTRFITNNHHTKVALEINQLLKNCSEFYFSVAFINKSGLAVLKEALLYLKDKNIPGKIVTSTYLNFNDPYTFEELLHFKNIEVRIYPNDGFHPKGYIFKQNDRSKIIIGSSNLTQSALLSNLEWNIILSSKNNGQIVQQIDDEFLNQWENSFPLTQTWINKYKEVYHPIQIENKKYLSKKLEPNKMQREALISLSELRKNGAKKALIISATGTGKTYLSAFDVQNFKPKKLLFIVHRENIARAAMNSFKNVLNSKKMGLYTGTIQDQNVDYFFATIQTVHKKEHLSKFDPYEFDYIIIDEVHRAGAPIYQEIFSYFHPKFLLGMSATPERTDDFDIFKLFDYNIAYEIRLQDAMKYKLLTPFHYYGISDFTLNNQTIEDKSDFNLLTHRKRVDYIIQKINQYGYSGYRAKGLIFCSRKDEAYTLSDLFNQKGYKTIVLTGEDSEEKRQKAIQLLESNDSNSYLDYIFTVDIFNEGIDIPEVNQIVMLRPTTSHIIFVQQLGRGLRKTSTKDYLVVIDFIGNYEKNFQIPIALSGHRSYNKDFLRRFVQQGTLLIDGDSTINFDEISTKRIFETIDKANFNEIKLIKESYNQLKNKLGRIPTLLDFDKHESLDPLKFFQNKSLGSYHLFLKKYEKDYSTKFTPLQEQYLTFISKNYAEGKRMQELLTIKECVLHQSKVLSHLKQELFDQYQMDLPPVTMENIINQLTQNYMSGTGKNTYKDIIFINKDEQLTTSSTFKKQLENEAFKNQVLEIIEFGINRYHQNYSNNYKNTDLCLYKKYTYEDVCRLLNWDQNQVALNIGGYKYDQKTNTFPVFINYHKDDSISNSTKYEDHFIDEKTLIAFSKNKRTLQSDEVIRIYNESTNHVQIHLFIRKNKEDKNESKEFYYFGQIHAIDKPIQTTMIEANTSVVQFTYQLEEAVPEDLYNYITQN